MVLSQHKYGDYLAVKKRYVAIVEWPMVYRDYRWLLQVHWYVWRGTAIPAGQMQWGYCGNHCVAQHLHQCKTSKGRPYGTRRHATRGPRNGWQEGDVGPPASHPERVRRGTALIVAINVYFCTSYSFCLQFSQRVSLQHNLQTHGQWKESRRRHEFWMA